MSIKITIENTGSVDLFNVELFDCLKKVMGIRQMTEYGVEISVAHPQYVSYDELVWNIATGTELDISRIILWFAEDAYKANLELKLSDLFGTQIEIPISIEIDPEQDSRVDKKILFSSQRMVIDKRASLLIKELKASSIITISLLREEDMTIKRNWFTPSTKTPDPGSKIIIIIEERMMVGVMSDNKIVKTRRFNSTEDVDIPWSDVEMWSVCEEEPILPGNTYM